jgi:hypothetical protein
VKLSRGDLLLTVVSLLLAFGVIEAGARRAVLLPYNPLANGWWEVQWLKRSARYSSTAAAFSIDSFHPTLGWTLRGNLRGVRIEQFTVNSNSRGVRGLREYPVARGASARVVVIGDSYTFGEGVGDDETFSARLERLLPDTEVINLAVHGYGTDQQALRLELDGLAYRPDVVILGYYEDDISRNRLWFRDYVKPHFAVVNGRIQPDDLPIPPPEAFRTFWRLRSAGYLDILLTGVRERQLDAENVVRSQRLFDRIAADAKSIGATLVEVYLPTPDQIGAGETTHAGLFPYTCAIAGVICVDPTPAMHRAVQGRADWKRLFRYHYAPEMHDVVARVLADAVGSRRR